jgi:hypothetical protein
MTDKEKIEFLLTLLKEEEFKMGVEKASALLQSYRWLIDKLKEQESK